MQSINFHEQTISVMLKQLHNADNKVSDDIIISMRKLTVSCRLLVSNFHYDDYTRLFADMADFLDVSRW